MRFHQLAPDHVMLIVSYESQLNQLGRFIVCKVCIVSSWG